MNFREEWQLDTRRLGRRVLVFDRVDSTNTLAAVMAQDAVNDGVVILAEEQTAGRGQHGRNWTCPRGAGVLLSAVLFPSPELRRPVLLAAWAAVAVCETVRECTGLQARIKWPNDVLLHGKKVCGILIEQTRGTVVGIGLNVGQSAESLHAAGLTEAAALSHFTERPLPWRQVARQLIGELDAEYDRLCQGDRATLQACWTWHSGLLGKQVHVEGHGASYHGRLREMTWEYVAVELASGQVLRLQPEAVRHVTALEAPGLQTGPNG